MDTEQPHRMPPARHGPVKAKVTSVVSYPIIFGPTEEESCQTNYGTVSSCHLYLFKE